MVSFEIIPALDNENKSPVFHDQHSLGLASWSVKPLYFYTYNRLLEVRRNRHRREEPDTLARWLLGALLLNPDVSTFWNMRRELVRSGRLEPVDELRFVALVLYYKAKCFEAFAYRRWLMRFALEGERPAVETVECFLRNEIDVATTSANRYANNCHAWSHREHVVTILEKLAPGRTRALLKAEWEATGKWCNRHVSDYSGLAYRQFLLKRLVEDLYREEQEVAEKPSEDELARRREALCEFVGVAARGCNDVFLLQNGSSDEFLEVMHGTRGGKRPATDHDRTLVGLSYWTEEVVLNEDLINSYPGHEALWYHRRFLAHALVVLVASYEESSSYRTAVFDSPIRGRATSRAPSEEDAPSRGLLEHAFGTRNKEAIATARRFGLHQNTMADRFLQFLGCIGLEP
ncbi:protein prenyltransferase alpha subunit repeat-containing protein 1 isoform X2 [Orussus abietinus]|uniref:protein prenyltransferase alpha subunit repeat-containing protein 1 isoform X2 n=1 Tax=Orussus abietinus TaxID=222816 RepID=UPI0006257782|nr:protein prenyltransferase alpha subunit repeat-containing protein 1 isoform X2 [Orussus abietinus]